MEHKDDIYSIDLHPSKQYATTCEIGKDSCVCVWNVDTMELVVRLESDQLKGGVNHVAFSPEGDLLTAIGYGKNAIVVFDWENQTEIGSLKGGEKVLDLQWVAERNNQFVICGKRNVKFITVENNKLKPTNGQIRRNGKIQTIPCVTHYLEKEKVYTVTGTLSGELYIWRQSKCIKVIPLQNANAPITCIASNSDLSVVVGGTKKGGVYICRNLMSKKPLIKQLSVKKEHIRAITLSPDGKTVIGGNLSGNIWSLTQSNDYSTIMNTHGTANMAELWGIAIHPTKNEMISVSDDKKLMLWDNGSRRLKKTIMLKQPSRAVGISPNGKFIGVGYNNGSFEIFHYAQLKSAFEYKGRKKEISVVRFSPDGKLCATASHDSFIDLFQVKKGSKWSHLGTLGGHSSYITSLDFSKDGEIIKSAAGDYNLLYHSTHNCKRQTYSSEYAEIEWANWTTVLGWPVGGVFREGMDGTDINSCDRSPDNKLLAISDDNGMVGIYNYPCLDRDHQGKYYGGHCSHVTKVRFTPDGEYIISCGGMDACIFIWKVNAN